MPVHAATGADALVLSRGRLRVEITQHPFAIDVRRDGRRLIRRFRIWCADGEVRDQFIQFTEGVIAAEELEVAERVASASLAEPLVDGAELALRFDGGRAGRLRITLPVDDTIELRLVVDGEPLRHAAGWDARDGEHFAGLGARHATRVDHAGRRIQLGADRAYTGPDCPPDMIAIGGVPQGDYAPAPWMQSSRGYALHADGHGNGMRFHFGDDRTTVSARANAGPLRLTLFTDPSPTARLRRHLEATGLPPVLPEWGYGFWKSRDVYGHQTEVEDDFHGCIDNALPLDALVLDSPWETQYNTWIPNPHQFPDFGGMVREFRAAGVRTVVWVTPWVNLDSSDGQTPPDPESRALHRVPASNYEEGERHGHYVRDAAGEPFVARWWMGTGSPIDFTSPAAESWWREQAKRALELGVEGIKADDGEGYYFPDDVRFADGSSGATAAWRVGGQYRRSMQRALDEVHPGRGVLFGRSGWTGQQATGMLWGGDQVSDFWSLRVLVAATISAAAAASRTGRTTSAAISATGSSSAARPSCSCAGPSSAASRRSCRRTAGWSRSPGPTTSARSRSTAPTSCCTSASCPTSAPRRARRRAAACRSSARCTSPTTPTTAAGRSPTPTASAPRCGSRRCSTRALARARSRCRAATGSRPGRATTRAAAARSSRPRRARRSRSGSAAARSS